MEQIQTWYGRQEPFTQIRILRTLALENYQSKTELAEKTGSELSNIDTIMKKLESRENKLIQKIGTEKITDGKRPQTMYVLTKEGIKILLENHYRDDEPNDESRHSGDPYLTKHEFAKFVFLLFDKKSQIKSPISKTDVFNLYFNTNLSLSSDFKQGKNIEKILKRKHKLVAIFEEDMKEVEEGLSKEMLKTIEKKFKKDNWKSRMGNMLKIDADGVISINETMDLIR